MSSAGSPDGSDDASSPDPLALSNTINGTPRWTTPRRRLGSMSPGVRKRELSFDAGTLRQPSPTKSIILDTGTHPTTSPWRIKVTVQAEPRSGEAGEDYMDDMISIKEASTPSKRSPSKRSPNKSRTTTVPLKDPDWTPKTPRGRGRPRKTTTPAPAKQKRKPTPARRKSDRPSTEELNVDETAHANLTGLAENAPPSQRKRGRPPKSPQAQNDAQDLSGKSSGAVGTQPDLQESIVDPGGDDDVELPDVPEHLSDDDDDDVSEPAEKSPEAGQGLREQYLATGEQRLSKPQSPMKKTQEHLSSPKTSTQPGRSGWPRFSPLPQRHSFPSNVQSHVLAGGTGFGTRLTDERPGMPFLKENENEEDGNDAAMWLNMISEPGVRQAKPAEAETRASASTSASEVSDDEEEDMEMPDNEPIGDETMMKSMDMTIVSPGSLYSKLDIHSSFASGKVNDSELSRQRAAIEAEDSVRKPETNTQETTEGSQDRVQAIFAGSSPQKPPTIASSPHVHFSSPLHPSPRLFSSSDRPNSIRRRQQSTQSPRHKISPLSSAEPKSQSKQSQSQAHQSEMLVDELETPSVGRHLPTPESDERPSHEENDMLDDIDDEPFDDLDADEEPDMNPEPELQDGTIDGDFPRNQFADQRLHDSSPSQAQSASISTLNEKRNEQWQREREEISRLAKAAGSKIVSIESDHEEDDDDNEDDGSADELDMWQEAGNQSSNSLGDSRSTHRPSAALYRDAQRKKTTAEPKGHASMTETRSGSHLPLRADALRGNSQSRFSGSSSAQTGNAKPQDEIAALFKAASKSVMQPRTGLEVDDSMSEMQGNLSSPISNEDTSQYLRRKVSSMLGGVGFSFDSETPVQSPVRNEKITAVPLKSPGPSASASNSLLSPPVDRRLSTLAYSPKRSSPLKRPLNVDDSSSSSSSNGGDFSLASDARQLRNEMQVSKRRAFDSADSTSSRVLKPVAKRPKKSLLKVTQERRARALFGHSNSRTISLDSSQNDITASSTNDLFEDASSLQPPSEASSLISQIWSFIPTFTFTVPTESIRPKSEASDLEIWPPSEPSHPLLKDMLLLPRVHPWTQNHYTSLRRLFNRWATQTTHFDPLLPHNAALLTSHWTKYNNVEISNWGYDCQITESLVVLAAVFAKLLILHDTVEFEELYSDKMVMGDAARSTMHREAITDWDIILRLFTVLVGHRVREDEASGIPIDRTNDLKWKFKGGLFWRRKGMLWGLLDPAS